MNREELAWAAGFFDGEGNCRRKTANRRKPNAKQTPLVSIAQTDPQVLERFRRAVFGLGKVYGPYKPKTPKSKPYWAYACTTFADSLAVVAAIYSFLSPIKQGQIKFAFIQYYNNDLTKPGPKRKEAMVG